MLLRKILHRLLLFQQAEYWTEVEASVTKVYYHENHIEEYPYQLRMLLVSDGHIPGFYDTEHFVTEDGLTLCFDLGTRWKSDARIETKSVNYGTLMSDPIDTIRYIAVYIPGRGYVTLMEKDAETLLSTTEQLLQDMREILLNI